MKQAYRFALLFFLAALAAGCNARPETRPVPSATAMTQTSPISAVFTETLAYSSPTSQTASPLVYETPTLQPRPTDTPTINYPAVIDHYLTPFTPIPGQTVETPRPPPTLLPTVTNTPTPTPLATDIPDGYILSRITPQKPPANWTPTPPPLVDGAVVQDIQFIDPVDEEIANGRIQYIQAATDLMNLTHADKDAFLKYVDGWAADTWSARGYTTWFVENDFDHDGKPEWLVNIPLYSSDPKAFCCGQLMMIFEKTDGLYHPVYYQAGGGLNVDWHIMQIADMNKDGNLEVVTSQSCDRNPYCDTPSTIKIGAWDGQRWQDEGPINERIDFYGHILFVDVDNDGTIELISQGRTDNSTRITVHTYGWRDGQFKLMETWIQPDVDRYKVGGEVHAALLAHNPKEAIRLAKPILESLPLYCDDTKSGIALEALFAYALDNQPQAVQNALNQINKFCSRTHGAEFASYSNVFALAYKKTKNAILACQATNRFGLENKPYPMRYLDFPFDQLCPETK